jgi:hypothetical protein
MRDWPWLVRGTVLGGAVGALAGLIVGLTVYAPTVPFAALELGVPAAFAGTLVGGIAELAGSSHERCPPQQATQLASSLDHHHRGLARPT